MKRICSSIGSLILHTAKPPSLDFPRLQDIRMSKRLNKRQQRELEELRELEAAKTDLQPATEEEVSESEAEVVTKPVAAKKFNPFDAVSRGFPLRYDGHADTGHSSTTEALMMSRKTKRRPRRKSQR
jgi:hypothetical protein